MRSETGASKSKIKVYSYVIFIFILLLGVIFNNINENASADNHEPVLNFYVDLELAGHAGDITALEWSPNSLMIASGSVDNTTRIWSTGSWANVRTLSHSASVNEISWSKNTLKLAISFGEGEFEIWNSATWIRLQNLTGHSTSVKGLDWSPNGTFLATGDEQGTIKIWDTSSWNFIQGLGMSGGVNDLKFNNNGDELAACSKDGSITVWDTDTWNEVTSFDATSSDEDILSIEWSADDLKLAGGSEENEVIIWDSISWLIVQDLTTPSLPSDVIWSKDDAYVGASVSGGISVWETVSWGLVRTNGLSETSQILAVSADPQMEVFASGSPSGTNNTILIWKRNYSPVLDPVGDLMATEDELFTFAVSATDNDKVFFSDDSILFDVDPDSGQISFTPTNDDVGEHSFTINVSDGKGGYDSETVTLEVINVDDPPEPVLKWKFGSDHVNISLGVGGRIGNTVSLVIFEDGAQVQEIEVTKENEGQDKRDLQLVMDPSRSYEAFLNFSQTTGDNFVAVTFEWDDLVYTKHFNFDPNLEPNQEVNLIMDDFFKAMGLVELDGADSFDIDNDIVGYVWDVENKEINGQYAAYSFSDLGEYLVNLTVESDNGIRSSVGGQIFLSDIPDKEEIEASVVSGLALDYLRSTGQYAVLSDNRDNFRIVDKSGRTTGFIDYDHVSEIEGIDLVYSSQYYEVYYFPEDMELTFNIDSPDSNYVIIAMVPDRDSYKMIEISGDRGVLSFEINENANSFSISTSEMDTGYSMKLVERSPTEMGEFIVRDVNITDFEKHHYFINDWEGIMIKDKAVSLGIDKDSDGEIDIQMDLENGMTGEQIQKIIVNMGQSESPFLSTSILLLIMGFVGIAGVGGLIGSTEIGKLALLSLILPLYTRIKKDQVLDNEIRGMIRGYIIANPGDNYNSIKRALNLNNGSLAYHLKVLERAKAIQSRKDGIYKRFYPKGMKIPVENGGEISEIQKILINKISESPGISQKEMANLLGLSKGVINYHVKVLLERGIIKLEKRGRRTYCFVNPKELNRIESQQRIIIKEV